MKEKRKILFDQENTPKDVPLIKWLDRFGNSLNKETYYNVNFISITGRAYPENAHIAWKPFINDLTDFFNSKFALITGRPTLEIIFDLDFYNTSSSKFITFIFELLQSNWTKCDITVKWYYSEEERDESDGEMYKDSSLYKKVNIKLVNRDN